VIVRTGAEPDPLVTSPEHSWATRLPASLGRFRVGQLLGLLFLIGPLTDLVGADMSAAAKSAALAAVVAFVVLYLALLPPAEALTRRGSRAIGCAVGLLAALAAVTLLLGAPRSSLLLFGYVVAAAGVALPAPAAVAVTAVVATAVAVGLATSSADGSTVAAWTLTVLGVGAVTIALGSAMRANAELRRVRDERARLAVAAERMRIARDLHDLLGHTLSLIALKTDLATRLVESDPERAQAELVDVQQVTRDALAEVREAVHGYRQQSFADALASARTTLAAAGIDCRVEGDVPVLPAHVETVLAWAVREAATNVVRHSDARHCAIRLRDQGDGVALEVDDDGSPVEPGDGGGAGLAGLGERARDLEGTFEAQARPEGGFHIRLRVPVRAT
jgi:two-component system, NarL family, sensor histidine kinase DesK